MSPFMLLAQAAVDAYSLGRLAIVCVVLGAIWYLFNALVVLPPQAKLIINVVLGAILLIVAIKVLLSFL